MMALQYLPWSSSAHACDTAGGFDPYAASGYGAHGSTPRASAPAATATDPAATSGADIAGAQLRVTRPATVSEGRAWSNDSHSQSKS